MTPEQFNHLDAKIEVVRKDLTDLRVLMERRVTAIEVKAGVLGVLAGAIGGWFSALRQ